MCGFSKSPQWMKDDFLCSFKDFTELSWKHKCTDWCQTSYIFRLLVSSIRQNPKIVFVTTLTLSHLSSTSIFVLLMCQSQDSISQNREWIPQGSVLDLLLIIKYMALLVKLSFYLKSLQMLFSCSSRINQPFFIE